jgi:hypothetical protein
MTDARGERALETLVTLILPGAPELTRAHDELYPERLREGLPLATLPFASPT